MPAMPPLRRQSQEAVEAEVQRSSLAAQNKVYLKIKIKETIHAGLPLASGNPVQDPMPQQFPVAALCLCFIHFQCGEENAGQDPNTYTVLQFLER